MSGYSLSFIPPGFLLPSQVWFHVFCVFHAVCEEKPQSLYVKVVDGVASLVEVITTGLSLQCLMSARCSLKWVRRVRPVSQCRVERIWYNKWHIYSVVRQAVELFCDVHLGVWTRNVDVGADERTCPHFAWWHGIVPGILMADWHGLRSHQHLYAISGSWLKIFAALVHDCKRLQLDWMILCTQ